MSRRLITIPLSHYCERARWALDWSGVDYVEEPHLQIFHARPVRRAGGRRTVPVLVAGDEVFADSADIVAHADRLGPRRLYPDDREERDSVVALERELADDFGVESRRLVYHWFLAHPKLILAYNNQGAPWFERLTLRIGFRAARGVIMRHLDINDATAATALTHVERTFDELAKRLEDTEYLAVGRFTAADLTFAAMAAPLVLPREYGVRLPEIDELPDDLATAVVRFRKHPAGQFALDLYRRYRHQS